MDIWGYFWISKEISGFFYFQYMIIDFSGFLEQWSRVFPNRLKNVGVYEKK